MIAQVERIAEVNSLPARAVRVPGILVDAVVVADAERHWQTYAVQYSPAFANELRVPLESLEPMPLDARKIIARRAAMELPANGVVNLGIGMPEGVASVANEEKILRYITLTAEPGVIGGVPASGLNFGAAVNTDAMIDQNQQFDFYDGGGLDLAVLGMAECDAQGDVNVSRFAGKLTGAGGFINISQNARAVVFTGTFTAGGLQVAIEDGGLRIVQEGRARKFVEAVSRSPSAVATPPRAARPSSTSPSGASSASRRAAGADRDRTGDRSGTGHPGADGLPPSVGNWSHGRPHLPAESTGSTGPVPARSRPPDQPGCGPRHPVPQLRGHAGTHRSRRGRGPSAVEAGVGVIGHRVGAVVNYDNFRIDEDLIDRYAEMVSHVDSTLHLRHPVHVERVPARQARRCPGEGGRQAPPVRAGGDEGGRPAVRMSPSAPRDPPPGPDTGRAGTSTGGFRPGARTTAASMLLSAAAGAVDLVAVVALGGAFAGIVTGNLVTLAGALATRDPTRLVPVATAVAGFTLGVATCTSRVASLAGAAGRTVGGRTGAARCRSRSVDGERPGAE